MARIRSIKPEFPHSESMGRVSRDARLTFVLMWTIADDDGRLRGNSRMLASLLFPYDDDAPKLIDGWLNELESELCITRYEVDGLHYIQICNWLNHQKIDHPSKSKIPAFDGVSRKFAKPSETLAPDLRIGLDRKGGEGNGENPPDDAGASPVTREPLADARENSREKVPRETAGAKPKKRKTELPAGFTVSERVQSWATTKGFDRLPEHFESFCSKARAKAYTYADWDEALMNAIRDDWAGLRKGRLNPADTLLEANRRAVANWQPPEDCHAEA